MMSILENQVKGKNTKKYCISNADEHSDSNKPHKRMHETPVSYLFLTFHVILSAFLFSLMFSLVKKLSYIHPGQLAFARNFGIFAGALPVAVYCVGDNLGNFGDMTATLLLILRGILGGMCLYFESISFTYLPVVEATIIISSLPAVTTLMARITLRESCGFIQTLILILVICGVLLTVDAPRLLAENSEFQPSDKYVTGLLAAVGNLLLRPFIYIAHRKVKYVHFSTVMLYFGFVSMLINAGITFTTSTVTEIHCGLDTVLFGLIVLLGFLTNMSITLLIKKMDAGLVTVFRTLEIVTAMVFQIIFFRKIPTILNICGGCLVMISVGILGIRNWVLNLQEESKLRKALRYLIM